MNKHFILILAILAFVTAPAFSQTYVAQVKTNNGKWGYCDNTGTLIIAAQFSKCHEFSSDGLAPVLNSKKNQYSFINLKGEVLATEIPKFKLLTAAYGFDIKAFNDGFVPVRIGTKCGYMNTEGKLAIPARYDDALEFNNGSGVGIRNEKYFVINEKGEEFLVQASEVKHFSENVAPFRDVNTGKYGFIGPDGKVAIPATFQTTGYFSNGLAWARTESGNIGFINILGEWVIKPQFDVAMNFNPESGVARIKRNGEWGYVNAQGEVMFKKDTDTYGDFNSGLALGKKDDKIGFFDIHGNWVIQPQFDAARGFKNGYAAVKAGGNWGFIDTTGKWVVKPVFDSVKDMELVK